VPSTIDSGLSATCGGRRRPGERHPSVPRLAEAGRRGSSPGHLPARGAARLRGAPPTPTPSNEGYLVFRARKDQRARPLDGHRGLLDVPVPISFPARDFENLRFGVYPYVSYRVSGPEITFSPRETGQLHHWNPYVTYVTDFR